MKLPLFLSLLCACAVNTWAAQPRNVVKPPPVVEVSFRSGKNAVATLVIRANSPQEGVVSVMKDRMVPVGWDLPVKSRRSDGKVGYIPATPVFFEKLPLGITVNGVAMLEKGLIVLNCKISQSEGRKLPTLYGEGVDQLDAGNGRVVKFPQRVCDSGTVTSDTAFQLYARPGKTYTIPVLFGGKAVKWQVKCSLVEP